MNSRWPCRFVAAHRPPKDSPSPHVPSDPDLGLGRAQLQQKESHGHAGQARRSEANAQPAALMKPLLISKANTFLQLVFVTACLAAPAIGVPSEQGLNILGVCTMVTTIGSGAAYLPMLRRHGTADEAR